MANKNPKKENLGDFRDLTAKELRGLQKEWIKRNKAVLSATNNRGGNL